MITWRKYALLESTALKLSKTAKLKFPFPKRKKNKNISLKSENSFDI